ncbi:MAG: outer membrane beta-barrel protein [Legionellaceae bacterium]|nr:outer membrane beta-barrel protein [Legionellaceae bacterium]
MKRISFKLSKLLALTLFSSTAFSGTMGAQLPEESAHWFVFGAIGGQKPLLKSDMYVNNGSLLPRPSNQDHYSVNQDKAEPMVAVFAGRYWQTNKKWFPDYALGLRYETLFSTRISGAVTQYSLPLFTNYVYNWDVSSNLLFASGKLNLFKYKRILPYVTGGLGVGFNRATQYTETALPSIAARVSPGFTNNTNTAFAYHVGAGLDFQLLTQWILSFAYQYMDLGNVASGPGVSTWAGESLQLGHYRSNGLFLGLTYLFSN